MQPKVELNQIRDLGQVVDDSILFFKQNWKPLLRAYITICGILWAAETVISVVNQIQTLHRIAYGDSIFTPTYFIALLFGFLNYTLIGLTGFSYITLYREKGKEPPTVEEVWSYVKYYFFRIFGGSIALVLLIIVATLCCIIPGVYFYPIFTLIPAIMVMENTSLGYAFSRSFQLIKGKWWSTFGISIVMAVIITAGMFLLIIPAMMITGGLSLITVVNFATAYTIVSNVVMHLLQFLYLLPVIATGLVYFSLTEQKDDLSLLQRIEMLGQHVPESDQSETEEY
jgi:hypothetical protein